MNYFVKKVSFTKWGCDGHTSFVSTIWNGISFLLLAAFFAGSSGVSAQSIYRLVAESDGSTASISVQPGETFTVSFGLEYVGVVTGTTEVATNRIRQFSVVARVFPFDATIGTVAPDPIIEALLAESTTLGTDVIELIDSNPRLDQDSFSAVFDPNEPSLSYSLGIGTPADRIDCNTNGCDLRNLFTVTYRVAEDASTPAAYKIGNTANYIGGTDDNPDPTAPEAPVVQRDELVVYVVQPQILAELRLNSGAPGGTLELTAVTPVGSTDTTLVSPNGETCLEDGTCQADTSFSTDVRVVIPANVFPSIIACGETTCTLVAEGALPIDLDVPAADFINGMASVALSTTAQYDLQDLNAGDGFFSADITINGEDLQMRVNVGADQTPPTVPAGFALSCAPTAYSALCSWPAGIDDPAPGAGLADFVVTLTTSTSCVAPDNVIDSLTVPATAGAASVEFANLDRGIELEPGTSYFACLTVQDGGDNMAAGSPFSSNFMTRASYQREDDEDGDGVPNDLEAFGPYADLNAAVTALGEDADGFDGPDSIAFVYGLPSRVPDFGALEQLTCNPNYARNAATENLETSCAGADALNGRTRWIVHVANGGDVYLPTRAPALAAMPRASGRYLISRVDGDTANLAVLTVLPQLGISYPVDGEGLALAPPDENPRDANPANAAAEPDAPTEFRVGALFGEGAIPDTVILPANAIAIVPFPDDDPAPMSTPPRSTTLTVALPTLASTTTALLRHTGIRIEVANTVMFSGYGIENVNAQVSTFTLADADIIDLDFIRIMLTDVVGASSQTNIACSTPQQGGDLMGAPDAVTPDAFSCTVSIGGSIFEPGEEGIVEIAGSGGGGGMLGWLSLVALAVLTMLSGLIRRRGIALAAALFLSAGLSPAAFAQPSTLSDPSHWRLGVDIGLGLIEPDSPNDEDNVFEVDDDSDFGWRISLEHDSIFHKDVGLEIFWADLGEAEVGDREEPELSAEVEVDIFGIGAVWHLRDLDFVADWSPYGSLGYRYVDGDLSGNFADNFDADSESGVYWNIGVEGSVYRDWNLLGRAFYEAYDEDLGFWGVGLVWHLGESSAPPRKRDKAKATKDRKAKRRSASREKAKSSSTRRESSRRATSSRRDMAAVGECKVPKGMTPKGWYVQVITYASADRARSMQNQLRRDDYTVGVADRGELHAVRVITDTCTKAQRIKRQLRRKLGVEPFVRPFESHAY